MPPPPQSPPKRMTRARAKAVDDKKSVAKTIKVATPSTKVVGNRNAKRKTRADEEDEVRELQPISALEATQLAAEPTAVQALKALPTRKVTVPKIITETRVDKQDGVMAKRPRGRPRKAPVAENARVELEPDPSSINVKNSTQHLEVKQSLQPRRAGLNAPPLRKKVTFDVDDSEKENAVRHPATPGKPTKSQEKPESVPKQTGVNAKPMRRPAPVTLRGKNTKIASQTLEDKHESSTSKLVTQASTLKESPDQGSDSDDLGDGRTVAKTVKIRSKSHSEKPKQPILDVNPDTEVAGTSITTSTSITSSMKDTDKLDARAEVRSPTRNTQNLIIVKTPAQRVADSTLKTTSKVHPLEEYAAQYEPKASPAKTSSSPSSSSSSSSRAAFSLILPPMKVVLEQPPSLPLFKIPALPSKITGSPIRRPTTANLENCPGTTVKPKAIAEAKSSIYGTPARKAASQNRTFAPVLTGNFPRFNGKSSLLQASPRRPSSPERTAELSLGSNHVGSTTETSSIYGSPARRPTTSTMVFVPSSSVKLASTKKICGPMASSPRKPVSPQKEFELLSLCRPAPSSERFDSTMSTGDEHQLHMFNTGSPMGSRHKPPSAASVMQDSSTSKWCSTPERLSTLEAMATSSLKSNCPSEAANKVHKMTPEEQANMLQDEPFGAPSPLTPLQKPARKHPTQVARSTPRGTVDASKIVSNIADARRQQSAPIAPYHEENDTGLPDISALSTEDHDMSTTPPGTPLQDVGHIVGMKFRNEGILFDDDDSEDELQGETTLYMPTHSVQKNEPQLDIDFPFTPSSWSHTTSAKSEDAKLSMTALADRFHGWKGISPDKKVAEHRKAGKSIFSPTKTTFPVLEIPAEIAIGSPIKFSLSSLCYGETTSEVIFSPEKPSHFEEAMAVREDLEHNSLEPPASFVEEDIFRQSQISEASQEYGDENAMPIDPLLRQSSAVVDDKTCTPARVFSHNPYVVHTVSKIPLKPSAEYDDSPLARPRRSHSLFGPLSNQSELELQALRQIHPHNPAPRTPLAERTASSLVPHAQLPLTPNPKSLSWSLLGTPARTPRPDTNSKLLNGCVVFVDVHTTEGADASGIFVDLLTQMGARCVKQWTWNSRSSSAVGDIPGGDLEEVKVGITHVVFKDGGRRTMEKVRETKGLVLCVGVGWVLDCERENRWLTESNYTIDTTTVPRGGHRRRKSMEPKALSNHSGNREVPIVSPTKEFLNLDTPTISGRETNPVSIVASASQTTVSFASSPQQSPLATPISQYPTSTFTTPPATYNDATEMSLSPTTPYFLHPQKLVQQTCPPKQTQESLFSLTAERTGEEDGVRRRLAMARRKSLQWAPRVGSPLRGAL